LVSGGKKLGKKGLSQLKYDHIEGKFPIEKGTSWAIVGKKSLVLLFRGHMC